MWLSHRCGIVTLTVLWIRKRGLADHTCPQLQNCRPNPLGVNQVCLTRRGCMSPLLVRKISLLIMKTLSVNFLF